MKYIWKCCLQNVSHFVSGLIVLTLVVLKSEHFRYIAPIPWLLMPWRRKKPGGCFTNVSRALQDILLKVVYCRNRTSDENFKLELCTCAQSHALGTRTKFQLEILNANVISGILCFFRMIISESSQNVSETTPWQDIICHGTWHWLSV